MGYNMLEFIDLTDDLKNKLVCGIDEAGRGPLAGPVVACACIPDFSNIIDGVNDSKKLSPKKRLHVYKQLIETSIYYKTVFISEKIIDKINILEATKLAMKECLKGINPFPDIVLIDAVSLDIDIPSKSIIKGDMKSYAIACASIIAKVERDLKMIECAKIYPEYGFEKHKGYGTKAHVKMLKKYGKCPIHRNTFIKNFV